TIAVGKHSLMHIGARGLRTGQHLRLQLLARDLILATEEPRGLSVRNHLRGVVRNIIADEGAELVEVDVDGSVLLARVTRAARRELALSAGTPVWVLVKAVSVTPRTWDLPRA